MVPKGESVLLEVSYLPEIGIYMEKVYIDIVRLDSYSYHSKFWDFNECIKTIF